MRWVLLLLVCYGASLIQIHSIHNHDASIPKNHHPRLQAAKIMTEFTQQHRERRPRNLHNATSDGKGRHLYPCKNSQGKQLSLPRAPDFIIGGET